MQCSSEKCSHDSLPVSTHETSLRLLRRTKASTRTSLCELSQKKTREIFISCNYGRIRFAFNPLFLWPFDFFYLYFLSLKDRKIELALCKAERTYKKNQSTALKNRDYSIYLFLLSIMFTFNKEFFFYDNPKRISYKKI